MSKVGGSYESVVLGVSEQVAQDRRSGQHEAQVNMVSDPVHGLARRRGSVWQDEKVLDSTGTVTTATHGPEGARMREFTFTIDGVEYSLLYRPFASSKGSTYFMYCYRKSDNKLLTVSYQTASALVNSLISGGVSALACVGRYLYIAGNTITPTYSAVDAHASTTNLRKMIAWVRGGAYSRTFTIRLTKTDGTIVTVSYKTMASAYPNLNDTSDILSSDPDYQKKLNDRNNLYNSNVTKWIGDAAADITPENIAEKLRLALVAAGITGVSRRDGTVLIDNASYVDISCDDGGDNTLMRGVGKELSNPDKLSTIHYPGHIVKIRPSGANEKDAFYMHADAKDGSTTTWTEVTWRESYGTVQTPVTVFAQAAVQGTTLYVAENGPGLLALGVTGPHPDYAISNCGDTDSAPVPAFFGKKITMLSVFQDRLLIGSNGTVNASRPGDYLNWYRATALNINDDDPVEMFAYGSEGDILRSSTSFDRSMVLFGDKKQYVIDGRSLLTPRAPNIQVLASYKDTTSCPAVSSGNFVFYTTMRDGRTAVHQFQVGQLSDTPASYEVSNALDKYIVGAPAQLVELTSPNIVLLRTEGKTDGCYVYTYLDSPDGGQRVFDSWGKWEFDPALGTVVGTTVDSGGVVVFTLRDGGGKLFLVADRITLDSDLSDYPYADSLRKASTISVGSWHDLVAEDTLIGALDSTTTYHLIGDLYSKRASLVAQLPGTTYAMMWVGKLYDSYVTPTNPYLRDNNHKAMLNGRLTLGIVRASVTTTGGVLGTVESLSGMQEQTVSEGRFVGRASDIIGTQPLITGQVSFGVGKEVRECKYTLRALTWLPMTITAIEWTGQWFNRLRRT